jgi:hypothetical protein
LRKDKKIKLAPVKIPREKTLPRLLSRYLSLWAGNVLQEDTDMVIGIFGLPVGIEAEVLTELWEEALKPPLALPLSEEEKKPPPTGPIQPTVIPAVR